MTSYPLIASEMTNYPIIANSNYESDDTETGIIDAIRRAVDAGLTKDAELLAALDDLECTLSESDSISSAHACQRAEQRVLAAWTTEVQTAVEAERIACYRE